MSEPTAIFSIHDEKDEEIREILQQVYAALKEKGYNPVNQLVGYILSEDPTYITTHNGARSLIRKVDRDDLLCAATWTCKSTGPCPERTRAFLCPIRRRVSAGWDLFAQGEGEQLADRHFVFPRVAELFQLFGQLVRALEKAGGLMPVGFHPADGRRLSSG